MKRRNLMTAFLCAVCLGAAPLAALAEEATEVVEEAEKAVEAEEEIVEAEADATETAGEDAAETTEKVEIPEERPDYVALDYVTLGDYKNITVEAKAEEVTDEMVEEQLEELIDQLGLEETLTEGKVQEGDIANIDYEGKKDGVAFEGGTSAGYDLTIGSGQFIDGFEEGLVGVEIGDTVDLELTFPENYHSEDLAGQAVVFTVTVNEVKRMPEVTDKLINEATQGEYEDIDALRAYARTSLEDAAKLSFENAVIADMLNQICELSSVETYPEDLKAYAVADTRQSYVELAAMYGVEFSEFLTYYFGVTEEEFEEQINAAVEDSLLKELCIKGIAETEGIEITEEEYADGCEFFAEQYGYTDVDEFIAYVGGENVVKISLLIEEVYDYFLEVVTVTEPVEEAETTEAEAETTEVETTEAEAETTEAEAETTEVETAESEETEAE